MTHVRKHHRKGGGGGGGIIIGVLVRVKMAFVRVRNTCIVHHKMPKGLGGVFLKKSPEGCDKC